MAQTESPLDEYIREKISSEINAIEVPNIDEQWAKFQKQIQLEEVKDNPIKRYRKIAWVSVFILILSTILLKPTYTQAFGEKFIELFSVFVGRTTKNQTEVYYTPSPGTPSVQDLGTNIEREVSLEEVQSMISYMLCLPNYLPEGSSVNKILLTTLGTNLEKVTIQYMIESNLLIFEQSNSGTASSRGSLLDTDDTQVEQVNIAGVPATLFVHKSGLNTLNWQSKGLLFQLTGKISSEELIKITSSIT